MNKIKKKFIKLFVFLRIIVLLFLISSCGTGEYNKNESNKPNEFSETNEFSEKEDGLCEGESQLFHNINVIYGEDNRLDMHEVCNAKHFEVAQSTLALVESDRILSHEEGWEIQTSPFGSSYYLCPSEPFYEQGVAAFCSGFLVTPNIIVTAGHCIYSQEDCERTKFVFGYGIHTPLHNPTIVGSDDVYSCQKLIHSEMGIDGSDYAVVQLDRDVVGRTPLQIRRSGVIAVNSSLVVVGHPSGLPTKVADGAKVRSLSGAYFVSNLDTYAGNSGSAVFNDVSGVVEGILVRGETDYVFDRKNDCNLSNRCLEDSCLGEEITKITEILKHIPEP